MKAAVINSFGGTSVLEIVDMPKPKIREDELLVCVGAAAINPKDTFIRKGRFKRFTGNRFPMQMGFDFAGEVVKAGDQVMDIQVGTHVYGMLDGWQGGTCAEYVAVKTSQITTKPESLTFAQAAALPMVSLTALQALRDEAGIKAGKKICINGASGGVGSMAVQISNIHQATVIAISSLINHEFLHDLGADICIDYHDKDVSQSKNEFDIFFDVFGNQPFQKIKHILSKKGVWVSTVLRPHVFISLAVTKFFGRKKAKLVTVKSNRNDLAQIRGWVEAGKLQPIVHDVFPLDRIREAHTQQETKHTRGKIVIRVN
jgi:NADPH:quinone reductase-like Zn-dependent oxidoreductase